MQIDRDMPEKRTAQARRLDFKEIYAEFAREKAAEQATLEAAMDAIPDSAFDDHPEVVDLRSKLATATAELKAAKAARAKIDKNPTPARIEELRAEIARREPALRVAEAAAVAKGDTAMPEVLKVVTAGCKLIRAAD